MKYFSLLLITLLSTINLLAQVPNWSASLGNIGFDKINYIKKAGTTTILICTQNKILGVSTKDKKIIWEQEINTNITDSTIKVHEGTPFVTIFNNNGGGKNAFF